MSKRLLKRVALSAAVISIAGVGFGAGAYAATNRVTNPLAGPYYICTDEHHNVTKIWGHGATASCPSGELLFKWDVQGPQGPRGLRGVPGLAGKNAPTWRAEVDNGAQFSVTSGPLGDTSASNATYADAGVVVDLGATDNLTQGSFVYDVTSAATVSETIWIGNGPQASTPGTYPLNAIDFCYGQGNFDQGGALTGFLMLPSCGAASGSTLTVDQIKANYPGFEAYAWVGITGDGTNGATATVNTVDGQDVHAKATVAVSGDKMIATVAPTT
jgi:hypothetical protein